MLATNENTVQQHQPCKAVPAVVDDKTKSTYVARKSSQDASELTSLKTQESKAVQHSPRIPESIETNINTNTAIVLPPTKQKASQSISETKLDVKPNEHETRPDFECYQCKKSFPQSSIHLVQNFRYDTLLADDFYAYLCGKCAGGNERLYRLKLDWNDVVLLALLNLSADEGGGVVIAGSKYFAIQDVYEFVDEHWNLFWVKDKTELTIDSLRNALAGPLFVPHSVESSGQMEQVWTVDTNNLYNDKILERSVEYLIDESGLLTKISDEPSAPSTPSTDTSFFESTKYPPIMCQICRKVYPQSEIPMLERWSYEILYGDNLFVFNCRECVQEPALYRLQMTWGDVVTLVLFNLILTTEPRITLNNILFFDCETQICEFALDNWRKMMRYPKPSLAKLSSALKTCMAKEQHVVAIKNASNEPEHKKCSWWGIDVQKFIKMQDVVGKPRKIESLVTNDGTLVEVPVPAITTPNSSPKAVAPQSKEKKKRKSEGSQTIADQPQPAEKKQRGPVVSKWDIKRQELAARFESSRRELSQKIDINFPPRARIEANAMNQADNYVSRPINNEKTTSVRVRSASSEKNIKNSSLPGKFIVTIAMSFEQVKLRGEIILAAISKGKSNQEIKELLALAELG